MESATSYYARRNFRSQALSWLSNRGAARRGRRLNCEWPGAGRKPSFRKWKTLAKPTGGIVDRFEFSLDNSPHSLPRRRTENRRFVRTAVVLNSSVLLKQQLTILPFRTCISAGCSHSHSLRTGGSVDPANVCADWMTTASSLAIGSFAAFAAWVTSGQSQTAISWCQTRTSHFL